MQFLHQPTATHMMQLWHKTHFWTSCEPHAGLTATTWLILINIIEIKKTESSQSSHVPRLQIYVLKALQGEWSPQRKSAVLEAPRSVTMIPNTRKSPICGTVRRIHKVLQKIWTALGKLLSTPREAAVCRGHGLDLAFGVILQKCICHTTMAASHTWTNMATLALTCIIILGYFSLLSVCLSWTFSTWNNSFLILS